MGAFWERRKGVWKGGLRDTDRLCSGGGYIDGAIDVVGTEGRWGMAVHSFDFWGKKKRGRWEVGVWDGGRGQREKGKGEVYGDTPGLLTCYGRGDGVWLDKMVWDGGGGGPGFVWGEKRGKERWWAQMTAYHPSPTLDLNSEH